MDPIQEQEPMIAGESATAIFDALRQMRREEPADGLAAITLQLPQDEMAPVTRALMRIEAELLLEEANNLQVPSDADRTEGQRQFDAFEVLVFRTKAAMDHLNGV